MSLQTAYDLAAPRSGQEYGDTVELLSEMSRDFAASMDIVETLRKALARITSYLDAEAGSLFLLENDDTELVCVACDGPVDITGLRIPAKQGIVGSCIRDNICQMVRDVAENPDFAAEIDAQTGFTTRSILCSPMSVKEQRIGAIEVLNKKCGNGLFEENDRHVLQALSSSAALAILNARMAEELVEQEKLRRELELAAEIQRGLLPERQPSPFPVCGVNFPARGVSGDFYNFFPLEDGRIGFAIGDVSGKGMNAALLMAKTSSLYRSLGRETTNPGHLLAKVNEEICETATKGMFVTMVGGVYDCKKDRLVLANAGHEPPLYRDRNGTFRNFEADAPPLGIAPGTEFSEIELPLEGGALYIFTDGVTESHVGDEDMLGVDGLKAMIGELSGLSMPQRLDTIAGRLSGKGDLFDDLTLLAVESQGEQSP
jgi:sigma-B regulation protein RsbU (phosphoserine phosphatase)|tara:strand:+ start:1376 stop:2662 length:1287 start_codon:yes stop_codon:yes gene_type:complete